MLVISIQSQVVYGYAGNTAAVPVLQAAGLTVLQVPTTILSNTPHYPQFSAMPVDADHVRGLLEGVMRRIAPGQVTAVLTGWMGSAAIVHEVAQFIARLKASHPRLVYLCDPVMGDEASGLYVDPACAHAIAERLVPLGDILKPNEFELARLVPQAGDTRERLLALAGPRRRPVVVSSVADAPGTIATLAGTGPHDLWRICTPRLSPVLTGTGDVLTARFLSAWLQGERLPEALAAAVGGIYAVIEAAEAGGDTEMPLPQNLRKLLAPPRRFVPEKLAA
ncbi:pyridoxal kinase [Orrella sp. JC864]|uniref:pyridoxal kinase n=1 Tax=Orrella sp. JC864 TaxID=3120298 RepID=UPI0012BD7BD4